jgi:hypothetical protein
MKKKSENVHLCATAEMLQRNGVVICTENSDPELDSIIKGIRSLPATVPSDLRKSIEAKNVVAQLKEGQPIHDLFELTTLTINAFLSSRRELTL